MPSSITSPSLATFLLLLGGCASPPTTTPIVPSTVAPPAATSAPSETPPPAPLPTDPPPPTAPKGKPSPEPAPPSALTSVQLSVENKCATKVAYCVEDGSSLSTSLGANTSATHRVSPGAKVKLGKGSGCTDTVYLVTRDSAAQKAVICK